MTTDNHDYVASLALRAISLAHMRSHETVTIEHILLALFERTEVQRCLNDLNLDQTLIQEEIEAFLSTSNTEKPIGNLPNRTKEFDIVFARTVAYSQISPRRFPNGLDILFQIIMYFEDSFAASIMVKFGLNHNKLRNYIVQGMRQPHREGEPGNEAEPSDKPEALNYIRKYCINLNELAEAGKIDPVVGRLSELERVVQIIARKTKNNVALVGEPGVGKAQPLYSQVLTPTGWKNMGDFAVGDVAITAQGSQSEIVGVYPQGKKAIWEILFDDGRKVHCCDEHLWKVYTKNWRRKKVNGVVTSSYDGWRVLNTDELRHKLEATNDRYYVPLYEDDETRKDVDLPLDPYVLGVLLGDGCLKGKMIRLSSPDSELLDRIQNSLIDGYELSFAGRYDWRIKRIKKSKKINDYVSILEDLELHGCLSNSKFIPESYFYGSKNQRLELLRGLLDTDGTVDGHSAISFCSVSDQLARDVQRLAWSLGGLAKIKERQTYFTYKGVKKAGQPSFNVSIRYREPKQLFHLQRQKAKITDDYQYAEQLKNKIEKITYVGEHEAQCIMIDDAERLYVTDNYVVTHNTVIIEGLAYNITQGDVPAVFRKSVVWSLDVGSLVAGTRFRGDFEERMKFLLKAFALIEEDQPILFIDEIHTIMDAGSGNKGSLDVSNLIKPALARGKLRCIGSTTDKDWRKHFEKDRALLRRFKKLIISEPSIEDAKLIIRGVRNLYETFHKVKYTEAALDAAVVLTSKYVHDGKLPDKAIDVIDEAGSRQRIIDDQPKQIIEVEDIEREVALITKIPVQNIKQDETDRLEFIEQDLKSVVFGQDHAIKSLVDAVLISRAGLRDANKPEGSYLFVGPTGVGKAQPLYSKIMTPSGWITMGNISISDTVCTPDGGSSKVCGVFPQGSKKIFRITFVDGRQTDCCEEHLWKVYNKHWRHKEKVIPLSEINRLLTETNGDYYVPLSSPVLMAESDILPLDPYLLGVLIGDGCYCGEIIEISSADQQIIGQVKSVLPDNVSLTQYEYHDSCQYRILGRHSLMPILHSLGMAGQKNPTKHIPLIYLQSSLDNRLKLLQGLIDTDGEVGKHGNILFHTTSPQLATDVTDLVRGLGGICLTTSRYTKYKVRGEIRTGKKTYRLAIRHPTPRLLVTLERKLERISVDYQYSRLRLKISSIEEIGVFEAQCIAIEHPDQLYITDDYVVTHNTHLAKRLADILGIPLVKLDMSEYMEKHSVSRLIGSPPGYVGFGDGAAGNGLLVNAIDNTPHCVLLLDEIEKAHPDVTNILLQVMEDAVLTNAEGKTVNLRNVILIMTSNIGVAKMERNGIGFIQSPLAEVDENMIKEAFSPEFRNRLDGIITFGTLDKRSIGEVVLRFIDEIRDATRDRGVTIELTDAAKDWLIEHGYDEMYGARPLRRLITEKIKMPLSRLILFSSMKQGGIVNICVEDYDLIVKGSS